MYKEVMETLNKNNGYVYYITDTSWTTPAYFGAGSFDGGCVGWVNICDTQDTVSVEHPLTDTAGVLSVRLPEPALTYLTVYVI